MNIPAVSEKQILTMNALTPQEIVEPQTSDETGVVLLNFKKSI